MAFADHVAVVEHADEGLDLDGSRVGEALVVILL